MKITTETALQWCAEIVPEWEVYSNEGRFWLAISIDAMTSDPLDNRDDADRLVEAFVGEPDALEYLRRIRKFTDYLTEIASVHGHPEIDYFAKLTATARQRTLAVLSAYKGEMVEVEYE